MQSLMGETPKTALHRFFPGAPTSFPSLDSPSVNWFGLVTLMGEKCLSKPEWSIMKVSPVVVAALW